jgi:GTPase SAR1 family protein
MSITSNYENLVKILILGDSNVGKTNFLLRFTENNFVDCTSSKSFTLNSSSKLYNSNSLAEKTLYISSYTSSSITLVDNYSSTSSINLAYIPNNLIINISNSY